MSLVLRSLALFGAITFGVHSLAEAQLFGHHAGIGCCNKCKKQQCVCVAPTPAACVPPATETVGGPVAQSCTKTCTTVHPVVQTSYRQEQYLTYRNECRTAMRQEAYCQSVPTTQVENVTRDEGCYKLVWCPKPVTRQYAKIVYQQRMAYRNVPYQYNVRVPQLNCRVVPQQSVRYVKQTRTYAEPMKPVGCAPVAAPQPMFAPAPVPQAAALPAPIAAPPTCAVPMAAPTCATPGVIPTAAQAPAPTVQAPNPYHYAHRRTHRQANQNYASHSNWTQVMQRQAANPAPATQNSNTNYMAVSTMPQPYNGRQQSVAPTAASVWQARR